MYHSRIVLSVGGSVRYLVRNLRCTVTIDSVLANSKTQNAFLFTVHAIFRHDYPLAVEPTSTPRSLVQKKTLRDSLPIDMLLSAVYVLVVAESSSEVPEGLMNNPVFISVLYMFRATPCLSSGESFVSIQPPVYVTLCRWPFRVQVGKDLNTKPSPTRSDIYQSLYWYNWFSWWWAGIARNM